MRAELVFECDSDTSRRSNFATRGAPEQIDAAARARVVQVGGTIPNASVGTPGPYFTEVQAYESGVISAEIARGNRGWAGAATDHGRARIIGGAVM